MDTDRIIELKSNFDQVLNAVVEENIEYWFARDLMPCLGYLRWENFETAIKRAMAACEGSEIPVSNHFRNVTKIVTLGSGAKRKIVDYMLTRYACYLIVMNGDPRKEEIAFAQSYFAVQTRKIEIIEERIKYIERMNAREQLTASETRLSKNIYERGVDEEGFGCIRSEGDRALFGIRTAAMKERLGIKPDCPLADFLPALTIAAQNLATEMTNYNVGQKDLQGERSITTEHIQNNRSVRQMLGDRGIKPKELPPAEDIKKLECRVESSERKIVVESGKLPRKEGDLFGGAK